MNDILYLVAALISGCVLGLIFFGGLWFTIKKSVNSKMPALWFVLSFMIRLGIVLLGFYFISIGNWQRLLICVLGFIAARYMVFHLTKSYEAKQGNLNEEVRHEA